MNYRSLRSSTNGRVPPGYLAGLSEKCRDVEALPRFCLRRSTQHDSWEKGTIRCCRCGEFNRRAWVSAEQFRVAWQALYSAGLGRYSLSQTRKLRIGSKEMTDELSELRQILVLSGPAGSGKTTIVHRLLAESPVPLALSISATTRPPRVNEHHGDHYYFLSPDEFQQERAAGAFLECAEVHKSGYWYGTLKSEVQRIHDSGRWVFLEIDVEGAQHVMRLYPKAVSVFLQTPSPEVYEQRLRSRATESEEAIQRRLRTAREELEYAGRYRYRVVNDDLDRAVREICNILALEEAAFHAG